MTFELSLRRAEFRPQQQSKPGPATDDHDALFEATGAVTEELDQITGLNLAATMRIFGCVGA